MPDPEVIVTFYSNCHQEPVDVAGVKTGAFNTGKTAPHIWTIEESISQFVPEGEFCFAELLEEKTYTEERLDHYTGLKVHVVASGGTWQFKIHFEAKDFLSPSIAYNASAASIQAVIPSFWQPSPLNRFRHIEKGIGGCPTSGGEESSPFQFIEVVELGPSEWEFRFYGPGGNSGPSGLSWQDFPALGSVFELFWFHDEVSYFVPLTRCLIGGGKAKRGEITQQGGGGGSRASPRPVTGNRA